MPPVNKRIARFVTNERVDMEDAEHLSSQMLDHFESVVGTLFANEAVLKPFSLSLPNVTTLRATRGSASLIVPEVGSADGVHSAGSTGQSYLFDFQGAASVDLSFAGAPAGYYHIYVTLLFTKTSPASRVIWQPHPTDPALGTESVQTVDTRYEVVWQLQKALVTAAAPANSVRIASVNWDGADMDAADLYVSAPMLFEGLAVPGGSAVAVPAPAPDNLVGPSLLPDFSRSDSRDANGSTSLAEFANAVLKKLEELQDPFNGKWWTQPSNSLSINAAQHVTFTIGTLSNPGNFTALTSAGGYWDVQTPLVDAIAAVKASGLPGVIVLKPGKYTTTALVNIDTDVAIIGAGQSESVLRLAAALYFTSGVQSLRNLTLESNDAGGEVHIDQGVFFTIERVLHSNAGFPGANLLELQAAGVAGTGYVRVYDCTSTSGDVDCSLGKTGSVTIHDSSVQSVSIAGAQTKVRRTAASLSMTFPGHGGVLIEDCVTPAMKFDGSPTGTGVVIKRCLFQGAPSTFTYRLHFAMSVGAVPGDAGDLLLDDCTFYTWTTAVGGVYLDLNSATGFDRFQMFRCRFLGSVGGTYSTGWAVYSDTTSADFKHVMRGCTVEDFAENGIYFWGEVDDCLIRSFDGTALSKTILQGAYSLRRTRFHVKAGLGAEWLVRDVGEIEECEFDVPATDALNGDATPTFGIAPRFSTYFRMRDTRFSSAVATDLTADRIDIHGCRFGGKFHFETRFSDDLKSVTVENCKVAGDLLLMDLHQANNIGGLVRMRNVHVRGYTRIFGTLGHVQLSGSTFANGLYVERQTTKYGGLCRIEDCEVWLSGMSEGGAVYSMSDSSSSTFPSNLYRRMSLSVFQAPVAGTWFDDVVVRNCGIKGWIAHNYSSASGGYQAEVAVVEVQAGRRLVFEGNRIDTEVLIGSVTTFKGLNLQAKQIQMLGNTINVDQVTGNSLDLGALVMLSEVNGMVGGTNRESTALRWEIEGNLIELAHAKAGEPQKDIYIDDWLFRFSLQNVDEDESRFFVVRQNTVDMRTKDASSLFLRDSGVLPGHATGLFSGNQIRDRAGNITSGNLSTKLALQKTGPVDVFTLANNIVSS